MNLIRINYLIFSLFLIQSCVIIRPIDSGNTFTIGTYVINNPKSNVTYNYNEINNNIELINKAKTEANKQIEEIKKEERKVEENNNLTVSQKNKEIEKLNIKSKEITEKLPKLDVAFKAWENIGFTNDDYRNKTDKLDDIFSKLKLADFTSFIGLWHGSFGGDAIKIYGNSDVNKPAIIEYKQNKNIILSFELDTYTGKITDIIIVGIDGYNFVKAKTSDNKFKLLGLKKYKIQEYLGSPRYIDKKKDYFLYGYGFNDSVTLSFYFSENICSRIEVHWVRVN